MSTADSIVMAAGYSSEPTLEAAIANSRRFAEDQVARLNGQLIARYNSNFDSWKVTVEAGKIPNTNPPLPPLGWIIEEQPDGFWYEVTGDQPIVARRTDIPADRTQQQIVEVGQVDIVSVPLAYMNRHLAGHVVTGAELVAIGIAAAAVGDPKSMWMRGERSTPFGIARFYVRI